MVQAGAENLVYGLKYSSVVPAKVTGEDVVYELTSMDLAMKLHYLRGVYFFNSGAVQGLSTYSLKEPMFRLLELYYPTAGRIRRRNCDGHEFGSSRPFIKCNDGGARIVEAQCDKTIDEWIGMDQNHSLDGLLVPGQVLGPDLHFSPLILIQFTWFKCGGISVGLSWAHLLGDALSSSKFINLWGRILAGNLPNKPLNLQNSPSKMGRNSTEISPHSIPVEAPLSLKQVGPVGDHWIAATNNCKMGKFTMQISASQLGNLQSKISSSDRTQAINGEIPPFEALSSVIWQCLASIREGPSEPRMVTICRSNYPDNFSRENVVLRNTQMISVVKAEFSVMNADTKKLAEMMINEAVNESVQIEEIVEKGGQGLVDFIVFGGNLTFVELEEAEIYGLELNGHKPVFANYAIDGIGDKGVVLVLPGRENCVLENGGAGRTVTLILPEGEISQVKTELKRRWCVA